MQNNIFNYAIPGYKNIQSNKYIGIFGNPIKHTLSPIIHDTISRELGIDERYIPFHITEDLDEAVNMAFDEGILGLNITVPYKQEVMSHLVDIDEAARVIGAVNTLVRCENGYKGYNTDMPGLAKALSSENIELAGSKVIMLGAGGAARAVAYMCLVYGVKKVYIVNRTFDNAKIIADDMNQIACDRLSDDSICEPSSTIFTPISASKYASIPKEDYIFIQCTSVGLHDEDELPLVSDEAFFDMAVAGVDLIYNPAKTTFLKLMDKLGKRNINGLKMLLYQGIMAYELWNEVTINEDLCDRVYMELYKAVYGVVENSDSTEAICKTDSIEKKNNIVLIGYMGAGKSAVGENLARRLRWDFIDTDQYIVELENMTINEIFATKGEEYFRDLETQIIKAFTSKLSNTIISTGGGLPMREENRKILRMLGTVYYLKATPETTYKRVSGNNDRPLLAGDNMYEKICSMLEKRVPKYEACCHNVIETDVYLVDEVVDSIIKMNKM